MGSTNHAIIVHSDELLSQVISGLSTGGGEVSSSCCVLVAAYKHIEKQKWVAGVVATILGTDLEELGRLGGFAHPEHIPQAGKVPNMPGWKYYFHGIGCCLTHEDGTEIDVDFPEGRYDVIDPYFFGNYISSLSSPSVLESRLGSIESLSNAWMAELPKLKELGLIEGGHAFELTAEGVLLAQEKSILWDKVEGNHNLFAKAHIALLLDDVLLARDFLSEERDSDSYKLIAPIAGRFESNTFENLMASLKGKDEQKRKDILKAAASIDDVYAEKVVEYILKESRFDSTTFLALGLIDQIGPSQYASELERLIDKAWRGKPPQPGIRVHAVRSLISLYCPDTIPQKLKKKLLKALKKRLDRMVDDAARLLYLMDKDSGLDLLGKCLGSDVPIVRDGGAASLAVVNTPKSLRLLENHGSITAATMIAIINNVEVAKIVPLGSEVEIAGKKVRTYSFDEIEAANMEGWLRSIYEETKKEYLPLLNKWSRLGT